MMFKRQNSIISKFTNNPLIKVKKQPLLISALIKEELEKSSFSSSNYSNSSSNSQKNKPNVLSESYSDHKKQRASDVS